MLGGFLLLNVRIVYDEHIENSSIFIINVHKIYLHHHYSSAITILWFSNLSSFRAGLDLWKNLSTRSIRNSCFLFSINFTMCSVLKRSPIKNIRAYYSPVWVKLVSVNNILGNATACAAVLSILNHMCRKRIQTSNIFNRSVAVYLKFIMMTHTTNVRVLK